MGTSADPHISSAVAFVEGGVQDACEDSCSICLESFCDSNPVTVTSCKHEYHLQCILEWSQRSKECPMCWQPLSLKDPNSQELLEAVEQERPYRQTRQMPSAFQRNSMEEFEFHQVPTYADDSDFEERIMQHLAAAARAHHFARRETLRSRPPSGQDHPQLVMVPTHTASHPAPLVSGRVANGGNFTPLSAVGPARVRPQDQLVQQAAHTDTGSHRPARSLSEPVRAGEVNRAETYSLRHRAGLEPVEESQQRTGPSEFQTFSESLKSRLAAASSRYKESFTKTTRGFREKLRARNDAMTDLGARAREVSAGVVRALERISLESAGKSRGDNDVPTTSSDTSDMELLPTLAEATSASGQQANLGIVCTNNSVGASTQAGVTSTSNRVSPQPSSEEAGSGFEGSFSKDIEGSSGGGDAQHITAVASSA